jgi:battenin
VPEKETVWNTYLSPQFLAFWLAGILNNGTYVIMNAGAKSIDPSAVGLVYVCNVLPAFLAQLTGPYWYHYLSYRTRMKLVAACMCASFCLVAYGQVQGSLYVQFAGIAITSFQSGFGEASFLAFSSFYPNSRLVLTGWSSGTGMAGIVGYAWVATFMFGFKLSFAWTLIIGNLFPLAYLLTTFWFLPWPVIERDTTAAGGQGTAERYNALEENGGAAVAGSINKDDDAVNLSEAATVMTANERLRQTLKLWKYMVPLVVVYFAEYATQSGTWAAIGFPITSKTARKQFYTYANWAYQCGVFVSRSSGLVCKADLKTIWFLPLTQIALFFFFWFDAYYMFWYDWSLIAPAFCVGLVGGAVYVGAFALIAEEVPPELKEFSMSVAIIADSIGILAANVSGLWIEQSLYAFHHIKD